MSDGATKRVIVTGATGMVGGEALRMALDDPRVGEVTSVGRRPTGIEHAKLTEVEHADFSDFAVIEDVFDDQDVALYCLGAYTGAVSDALFEKITVDFTVAFARALRARSPGAAFCFLSGQGADRTGKSRMAFARHKGAAENALLELGFARVHSFRPGYIYPVEKREEPNAMYRVMRAVYPVLGPLLPNAGVPSTELARAMVEAGLDATVALDDPILENRDIRALFARV